MARVHAGARDTAREALVELMVRISRSATGMSATIPGVEDKFRVPWNSGDSVLLNSAHAFAENAAPLVHEFVSYEMTPTFVDDLSVKIADFEKAFSDHTASRTSHVATSKQINDAMQRALSILAQLDPIIENKVDGNLGLMAQWDNVRHTERAWTTKKPADPKPEAAQPAA